MMLVFSTKLPLKSTVTRPQCIAMFEKWVVDSYNYPFSDADFKGYDINGHEDIELEYGQYSFSITHYKDDNITLSACRLVNNNGAEIWTTQNVVVFTADKQYLSVQTHYMKQDFYGEVKDPKPPFSIKLFIRAGLCDLDDGIPVSEKPICVTPEIISSCGRIMQGKGTNIMPIVYISRDYWDSCIDTEMLSRNLLGQAHVLVEPDIETSVKLRQAANGFNVYRGYVGIYFPGRAYYRKLSESSYTGSNPGLQISQEIIDTIKTALLSKTDSAEYNWDQIKALQHRQKVGKLELKTAQLQDLRDWYNAFMDENEKLTSDLEQERNKNASLFDEVQKLQAMLDGYKQAGKGKKGVLLNTGAEQDLYPGEINDLLLEILSQRLSTLKEKSRPYHIVEAILAANDTNGTGDEIYTIIKDVFSNGGGIGSGTAKRQIASASFNISGEGEHYKLVFANDPRYTFTVAKTPSDNRAGDNTVSHICSILFLTN